MIGSHEVKDHGVRCIDRLPDPLGERRIHKALRAVAKRAGVPAGIAADALVDLLAEIPPSLLRGHGAKSLNVRERVLMFFLQQFCYKHVMEHRVGMGAGFAGRMEEFGTLQGLFNISALETKAIPCFLRLQDSLRGY